MGFPGSTKRLPVIRTCADGDGRLAELDGLVAERLTMVSSTDGSGGFTSALTGGSSGASVNGGEGGLDGLDARTGGSSTGLVAFAFLDLAWPLREMLQDCQYKDTI